MDKIAAFVRKQPCQTHPKRLSVKIIKDLTSGWVDQCLLIYTGVEISSRIFFLNAGEEHLLFAFNTPSVTL